MATVFKLEPELAEILIDDFSTQEPRKPFQVDSIETANWALTKLLSANTEVERYRDLAQQYKRRIDGWFAESISQTVESIDFFEGLLKPWVQTELAEKGGRSRSIRLPSGTIGLRKTPDKVEVANEQLALEYCEQELPQALVVKKSLAKAELKASLKGRKRIPGVTLLPGVDALVAKGVI